MLSADEIQHIFSDDQSKLEMLLHVVLFGLQRASLMYPASRAFLSGKSFSMYIVVRVSGISCCRLMLKDLPERNALLAG